MNIPLIFRDIFISKLLSLPAIQVLLSQMRQTEKKPIIRLNQPPVSLNSSAFSLSSLTLYNYALRQSPNQKIVNLRCWVVLATKRALHFQSYVHVSVIYVVHLYCYFCLRGKSAGRWLLFHRPIARCL